MKGAIEKYYKEKEVQERLLRKILDVKDLEQIIIDIKDKNYLRVLIHGIILGFFLERVND